LQPQSQLASLSFAEHSLVDVDVDSGSGAGLCPAIESPRHAKLSPFGEYHGDDDDDEIVAAPATSISTAVCSKALSSASVAGTGSGGSDALTLNAVAASTEHDLNASTASNSSRFGSPRDCSGAPPAYSRTVTPLANSTNRHSNSANSNGGGGSSHASTASVSAVSAASGRGAGGIDAEEGDVVTELPVPSLIHNINNNNASAAAAGGQYALTVVLSPSSSVASTNTTVVTDAAHGHPAAAAAAAEKDASAPAAAASNANNNNPPSGDSVVGADDLFDDALSSDDFNMAITPRALSMASSSHNYAGGNGNGHNNAYASPRKVSNNARAPAAAAAANDSHNATSQPSAAGAVATSAGAATGAGAGSVSANTTPARRRSFISHSNNAGGAAAGAGSSGTASASATPSRAAAAVTARLAERAKASRAAAAAAAAAAPAANNNNIRPAAGTAVANTSPVRRPAPPPSGLSPFAAHSGQPLSHGQANGHTANSSSAASGRNKTASAHGHGHDSASHAGLQHHPHGQHHSGGGDNGAGAVGDVVDLTSAGSVTAADVGLGLPLGLSDESVIFAPGPPTPRNGNTPRDRPAASHPESHPASTGASGLTTWTCRCRRWRTTTTTASRLVTGMKRSSRSGEKYEDDKQHKTLLAHIAQNQCRLAACVTNCMTCLYDDDITTIRIITQRL